MKNLLNKVIIKRRHLVLEEKYVTNVLAVINKNISIWRSTDLAVGNCGWADTTKWFIHIDASKDEWTKIKEELYELSEHLTIKQ